MNAFRGIVIFLLGAAIGGVVVNHFTKEAYAKRADEEIESVKEFAKRQIQQVENNYTEEMVQLIKSFENGLSTKEDINNYQQILKDIYETYTNSSIPELENIYDYYNGETEENMEKRPSLHIYKKPPLQSVVEEIENDIDLVDDEEEEDEDDTVLMDDTDDEEEGILLISGNEFSTEKNHYDKLSIYYYEEDDVLADENDGIIPNPDDILGDEALTSFDESNVVYVRNNRLGADYEILRLEDSYKESILGIIDQPSRRGKNHNGESE